MKSVVRDPLTGSVATDEICCQISFRACDRAASVVCSCLSGFYKLISAQRDVFATGGFLALLLVHVLIDQSIWVGFACVQIILQCDEPMTNVFAEIQSCN